LNRDELVNAYLDFFKERGHTVIPSSSLLPPDDPTLLLTTAGMVQIKPYFLGLATPPSPRLVSCQKCFRTTDIESVGDAQHLTFFEMLGNFSVGDYFKKEAIAWSWEFVTAWLKLPQEKLWISVFAEDDESFQLWREQGIAAEKIVRLGEKDNFWGPAGDVGPCGPCSEIHYDFGRDIGCGRAECAPGCDCGRFCEIWNLVFTQYNQDESGNRTPLPKPNIDTGMGVERVVTVLDAKSSVYETDIFRPLLERIAAVSGVEYGQSEDTDLAMRVVAEHGRAVAFLIADGVLPSNEGAGYVLRRLLRRSLLFARRLGLEKPFLGELAAVTIERLGHIYPELPARRDFMLEVISGEENRFRETLNTGLELLERLMEAAKQKVIPGQDAFTLYDTYGFPVEITREIAAERGFSVDEAGFEREMEKQRERARAARNSNTAGDSGIADIEIKSTPFSGYENLTLETKVHAILQDGKAVEKADKGAKVSLVLESTPCYGEMGGQAGDTGRVSGPNGVFTVTDTGRSGDVIIHQGIVAEGNITAGEKVTAVVDAPRRADIARNHTATHLLQYALRRVLGTHVQQRGSLVSPERLRFDFSHLKAVTPDELREIEAIVNEKVRANLPVTATEMPYKKAIAAGAIALFDEKYGDEVRVVSVGEQPLSVELCGGTHVNATGEIGLVHIIGESSIGAGIRRIEALSGRGAADYLSRHSADLKEIGHLLKSPPEAAAARVAALLDELDTARRQLEAAAGKQSRSTAAKLTQQVEDINGVPVLAATLPEQSIARLREINDGLAEKLKSAVVVLGSVYQGKPVFLASVSADLVERGYDAGKIIREVAKVAGGGGGGKARLAQAGGKDAAKLEEAVATVKKLI